MQVFSGYEQFSAVVPLSVCLVPFSHYNSPNQWCILKVHFHEMGQVNPTAHFFFQPLVICSCFHHQLVRKVTQQKKWFSDKLVSWGPQWTLISRQGKVEYQWKNWTPAWHRSKLLSTQLCFPLFFFPPSSFFSSFPHLRSPISCCLTSYLLPRVLSLHQR